MSSRPWHLVLSSSLSAGCGSGHYLLEGSMASDMSWRACSLISTYCWTVLVSGMCLRSTETLSARCQTLLTWFPGNHGFNCIMSLGRDSISLRAGRIARHHVRYIVFAKALLRSHVRAISHILAIVITSILQVPASHFAPESYLGNFRLLSE